MLRNWGIILNSFASVKEKMTRCKFSTLPSKASETYVMIYQCFGCTLTNPGDYVFSTSICFEIDTLSRGTPWGLEVNQLRVIGTN